MAEGETHEIDQGHYAVNEGEGLTAMMLAGLGVGQHLRRFLQPHIDAGRLVPLLTRWQQPPLPFHLLSPPNRHQSARLRVFTEWMVARFAAT